MKGWRKDLSIIRESLTQTPSESWRADWEAIAGGGRGWRESVRIWAQSHGVPEIGWRGAIIGVAEVLGVSRPGGWRANLRGIREHYEGSPPEPPQPRFFIDAPPRLPNTEYVVLASGVIEADNIIMA